MIFYCFLLARVRRTESKKNPGVSNDLKIWRSYFDLFESVKRKESDLKILNLYPSILQLLYLELLDSEIVNAWNTWLTMSLWDNIVSLVNLCVFIGFCTVNLYKLETFNLFFHTYLNLLNYLLQFKIFWFWNMISLDFRKVFRPEMFPPF